MMTILLAPMEIVESCKNQQTIINKEPRILHLSTATKEGNFGSLRSLLVRRTGSGKYNTEVCIYLLRYDSI